MKPYLNYLIALLCTIILSSPALGLLTYYGGFGSNLLNGDANAQGGAYYDIYDTPDNWKAEYGIDAEAFTYGMGKASSDTIHSISTGAISVTLGGTDYNVALAYGGPDGAEVRAVADQETDGGSIYTYANIYTLASIQNNGLGNENMYGVADISAKVYDFTYSSSEASASASGLAGYDIQKCPTCDNGAEEIWGAVSGSAIAYGNVEDSEPNKCNPGCPCEGAGYVSGYSEIKAFSSANKYIPTGISYMIDHVGSYAGAAMYSYEDYVRVYETGTHALGYFTTSGTAMSGAWDATTGNLIKQQSVNENSYAEVQGATSAMGESFIDGDEATSYADLETYSTTDYYPNTDERYLYSEANYIDTSAHIKRDATYDLDDLKRVTAIGYITDANYDAIARQAGIQTEVEADKVNVASGAHTLNPGDWYSEANLYDNYAEYRNGYMEADFDFYNSQKGPKFILSGTMLDDSGSYIRLKNVNSDVSIGGTDMYGLNIDNIDFMTWIEGSSLVDNMYPIPQTCCQKWTTTFTAPMGAYTYKNYDRFFDNTIATYRISSSEIKADTHPRVFSIY